MNRWTRLLLAGVLVPVHVMAAARSPDAETLASIATNIESLKDKHPQLKEFSRQKNLSAKTLSISYAYRTHEPRRMGGWTSGVPNPDVWFALVLAYSPILVAAARDWRCYGRIHPVWLCVGPALILEQSLEFIFFDKGPMKAFGQWLFMQLA